MTLEKINVEICVDRIKNYLVDLQTRTCDVFEKEDGTAKFLKDKWQHTEGGGGLSCVLTGDVLEKAGVNFSHVSGQSLPIAATAKRPELKDSRFQALGVSIVVHPNNPYVPTSHANVRFIVVEKPNGEAIWWFGGGFDLTPYYGNIQDCQYWHQTAKKACEGFGWEVYPRFKKWCDDYFYLKHRQEPRGVGGLFFDDLNEWGFERSFEFMRSIGEHYILAYQPILSQRKNQIYGEREKNFQLYRRGRYVEFNLLYDRGTLFGLQSGGRTESILMSLPPLVSWEYSREISKGSEEEKLYQEFLVVKDWVSSTML